MKTLFKRTLSIILCVCMLLSAVYVATFAVGAAEPTYTTVFEEDFEDETLFNANSFAPSAGAIPTSYGYVYGDESGIKSSIVEYETDNNVLSPQFTTFELPASLGDKYKVSFDIYFPGTDGHEASGQSTDGLKFVLQDNSKTDLFGLLKGATLNKFQVANVSPTKYFSLMMYNIWYTISLEVNIENDDTNVTYTLKQGTSTLSTNNCTYENIADAQYIAFRRPTSSVANSCYVDNIIVESTTPYDYTAPVYEDVFTEDFDNETLFNENTFQASAGKIPTSYGYVYGDLSGIKSSIVAYETDNNVLAPQFTTFELPASLGDEYKLSFDVYYPGTDGVSVVNDGFRLKLKEDTTSTDWFGIDKAYGNDKFVYQPGGTVQTGLLVKYNTWYTISLEVNRVDNGVKYTIASKDGTILATRYFTQANIADAQCIAFERYYSSYVTNYYIDNVKVASTTEYDYTVPVYEVPVLDEDFENTAIFNKYSFGKANPLPVPYGEIEGYISGAYNISVATEGDNQAIKTNKDMFISLDEAWEGNYQFSFRAKIPSVASGASSLYMTIGDVAAGECEVGLLITRNPNADDKTARYLTIYRNTADGIKTSATKVAVPLDEWVTYTFTVDRNAGTFVLNLSGESITVFEHGTFTPITDSNLLLRFSTASSAYTSFNYIDDVKLFLAGEEADIDLTATEGGSVYVDGPAKIGGTVTLIAEPDSGYEFVGWYQNGDFISDETAIEVTLTDVNNYEAVFRETSSNKGIQAMRSIRSLIFNTNGGSKIRKVNQAAGTIIDLAKFVPVKEGYTFTGWYSDKALTKPVKKVVLNWYKTIYAGWEISGAENAETILSVDFNDTSIFKGEYADPFFAPDGTYVSAMARGDMAEDVWSEFKTISGNNTQVAATNREIKLTAKESWDGNYTLSFKLKVTNGTDVVIRSGVPGAEEFALYFNSRSDLLLSTKEGWVDLGVDLPLDNWLNFEITVNRDNKTFGVVITHATNPKIVLSDLPLNPLYTVTDIYFVTGYSGYREFFYVDDVEVAAIAGKGLQPQSTPLAEKYDDTTVIPQQFGAKGDGKTDDIFAIRNAIKYAKANGLTVTLPEADYYTSGSLNLEDVTIISENAKISYYGMTRHTAAITMYDNVNIKGTLNIWTIDNEAVNHGGRCGITFGEYNLGTSAHNCYVESLVITGGVPNANGVLITGASSNITIGKVVVPSGTTIGRAVLVHWDGIGHHAGNGSEYIHDENWQYTNHPHDIHIGTIEATDLDNGAESSAAFLASAAYDITVDEVIANNCDFAVAVYPGDIAFEYASPEEKLIGSRNILVKKVVGRNITGSGIYACGFTNYISGADALIELTVEEADIEMSTTAAKPFGLALHQVEKFELGTLNIKNVKGTIVHLGSGCLNVNIDTINAEKCTGVVFESRSKEGERLADNVNIGVINLTNCNMAEQTAFILSAIENFNIDKFNFISGKLSTVMELNATIKNIHFGEINAAAAAPSVVANATAIISKARNVSIGTLNCGDAELSSGSQCNIEVGN